VYHVIAAGESCRPAWALSSSSCGYSCVDTIVRQVSDDPPTHLVKAPLLFRGVDEVEVPQNWIVAKRIPEEGITSLRETAARDF